MYRSVKRGTKSHKFLCVFEEECSSGFKILYTVYFHYFRIFECFSIAKHMRDMKYENSSSRIFFLKNFISSILELDDTSIALCVTHDIFLQFRLSLEMTTFCKWCIKSYNQRRKNFEWRNISWMGKRLHAESEEFFKFFYMRNEWKGRKITMRRWLYGKISQTRAKAIYNLIEAATDAGRWWRRETRFSFLLISSSIWTNFLLYANRPTHFHSLHMQSGRVGTPQIECIGRWFQRFMRFVVCSKKLKVPWNVFSWLNEFKGGNWNCKIAARGWTWYEQWTSPNNTSSTLSHPIPSHEMQLNLIEVVENLNDW